MGRRIIATTLMLAFTAVLMGAFWFNQYSMRLLKPSLQAELDALSFTSQMIDLGDSPEKWPTRLFLPASVFESFGSILNGTKYTIPIGDKDEKGHFDGTIVVTALSIKFGFENAMIAPRLVVNVVHTPDRENPWWSGAEAEFEISSLFVPVSAKSLDDASDVKFKFIPKTVGLKLSWKSLKVSTQEMASKLIANGVFNKYLEGVQVPIPTFKLPLAVNTKVYSQTDTRFPESGGYTLIASMAGKVVQETYSAQKLLITKTGLWFLGGVDGDILPPAPFMDEDIEPEIRRLRRELDSRIDRFQHKGNYVEARFPNSGILGLAEQMKDARPYSPFNTGPAEPYRIDIRTANANGFLGKPTLLRDDILGEISLAVLPKSPDFARGSIVINPPIFKWVPGVGIQTSLTLSANLQADLQLHLSTGNVGGGIGKSISLLGSSGATIPVSLNLGLQAANGQTAIVLQPAVGCQRISIDVMPSNGLTVFDELWIKLASVGIRIKQNVGGGKISPSVILDSVPRYIPLAIDPSALVETPFKGIEVAIVPQNILVDSDSLGISANILIQGAISDSSSTFDEVRRQTAKSLAENAPAYPCAADQDFALLIAGAEIGKTNDVIAFVVQVFKVGGRVADETKKQVQALTTYPLDTLAKVPDNVIREGGRALENAGKSVEKGVQDVGKTVEDGCKRIGLCH